MTCLKWQRALIETIEQHEGTVVEWQQWNKKIFHLREADTMFNVWKWVHTFVGFVGVCRCLCQCFHDVADSLGWTRAVSVRLDSLSVEHPCAVSFPSHSIPISQALPSPQPLSLQPYQCPSIRLPLNFSFQVQSFLTSTHSCSDDTSSQHFPSFSIGLSICRPPPSFSLSCEVNKLLQPVATCQSLRDSQQNGLSYGHVYVFGNINCK